MTRRKKTLRSVSKVKRGNGKEAYIKFDQEKNPLELLDAEALEDVARVLQFGAKKYSPNMWRGGISYTRIIGATLRHVFAFMRGEDLDPETGLNHLAHAMCELMFLIWFTKHRTDLDDRYKND